MSRYSIAVAAFAAVLAGCFQPVGIGGGSATGGSSSGGTTGGAGCTCANGYRCSPDPRTGPDCVPLQCGALDESECRVRSDCTVVVKPNDGFDHCQATQCPAMMCPAEIPDCDPVLDADGCPTCGCRQTGCTQDSDCPSGESCELPICDGPGGPCPTYGTCAPQNPPPPTCSSDADCSSGEHCLPDPSGTCNCPSNSPGCTCASTFTCQVGCSSDADCADGEVCENGALTGPGECVARGCTTDADCTGGQYCDIADCDSSGPCPADGVCADRPDAGSAGCTADSDCGPGSHCEQPECFSDPCPAICVPDETDAGPAGCLTNTDCGAGERCDRPACENMLCCDQIQPGTEPPCIPDTTPGQCVPATPITCSVDADCPNGEACFLCQGEECNPGICAPTQTYACGNTFCGSGQACVVYGGASNTPVCVDEPMACFPTGGRASCDCIGQQICGTSDPAASTDCSGAIPYVSCGFP